MYIKAEKYYREEKYSEALDLLNKCLNQNRRSSLTARSVEQKADTQNDHAKIKLLEGKIHFKMGDIDKALFSYDKARQKLTTEDNNTKIIKAHLNYQLSKIAISNNDHEKAVEQMKLTVDGLINAKNYENAINHIFKMIKYCSYNNLELDFNKYMDIIDNLNKKKIKNKEFKRIQKIKLNQSKSNMLGFNDLDGAKKELQKVRKDCLDLGIYNHAAQASIQLARYELYNSVKNAERMLKNLLQSEFIERYPLEKGMAIVNLAMIKRMKNETDISVYEERGLEEIENTNNIKVLSDMYIDVASTIMLTSNDQDQFDRAKNYVLKAFEYYKEIDNKTGKVVAKLLEGVLLISRNNIRKGRSTISLATVNARRLGNDMVKLQSKFNLYIELLVEESELSFEEHIVAKYKKLPPLELASMYHIHGLVRINENKEKGIEYLRKSKEIYDNIVKKEKSLSVFVNILQNKIEMLEFMTLANDD